MFRSLGSAVFVVTSLFAAVNSNAADWPQWRGPNRDGAVDTSIKTWPDSLTKKWQLTVGEGHSSPVVAGGRVFQFSREDDSEVVRCLDLKTGGKEWTKKYAASYKMHPAARSHGKGPKSTPAVADGRLFTFGISGILTCFDVKDGRIKWQKDFSKTYKLTSPLFGTAASPLVYKGTVIVHVGGNNKGALTAFDVTTGKQKWAWDKDGPGYASPVVVRLGGARQLVTQTQQFILAVDPDTGRELWKLPYKTAFVQNIITPLVYDGLLIVSGFRNGTQAYRIEKADAGWKPTQVWTTTKAISEYMSTPVIHGKLLFGLTHNSSGQLFCASPKTGKVYWTGPGRTSKNAALISTANAVLVQKSNGELLVLKPTYERLSVEARYRTSKSPVWAHPALAGRLLLVKDAGTLICYAID